MAQVSTQYRGESMDAGGSIWLLLIPLFAVVGGFAIYHWYGREPAAIDTPEGLLHELCQAHGLPSATKKLLLKMGRAAELDQPGIMFLSIDGFESIVKTASRRIRYTSSDKKQLGLVRRRVFIES